MLSRREFLRRSFLFALGGAMAACSPPATPTSFSPATAAPSTVPPLPSSTRVFSVTPPPSATAAAAPGVPTATMTAVPASPTAGQAYLAVARGTSPAAITRAALDALGGIGRFVKPGNDVILKPNICNASLKPEYASTTNPEVMAALVQMCLEAGAKRVRVMDQPFSGVAVEAYKTSGIREAVERAGGQMEVMSQMKYVSVDFPHGRDIKKWQVYQDILKADVVINVPIAKTHDLARLTLGMKGLMGVITDRNSIHNGLHQRVADLSTVIRPTLNLIDGVRVLTRGGPTNWNLGDVAVMNTVIASHDIVAADAYAAQTLFRQKPEDIGYIRFGAEMGVGRYDFNNMNIKEVTA